MKLSRFLILGGIVCSFSLVNASEIKEVKTLDDFSKEIISGSKSTATKTKEIKKDSSKNIEKNQVSTEVKDTESNLSSGNVESFKQPPVSSIVDVYDKKVEDGIAYKVGDTEKFTGTFGIVLDGKIEFYENYKDGLLDGESAWFSRDGKIKLLSEPYSKGKLNGDQKTYYETGEIKYIIKYVNNRIDGITCFNPDGSIKFKSIYKNGTGDWKIYWSNGKILEEGRYVNWKKDGVWKRFHKDGSIDTVTTYDKGRILKESWS